MEQLLIKLNYRRLLFSTDRGRVFEMPNWHLKNCGYNRPRRQKVHAICFYGARDINALCSAS